MINAVAKVILWPILRTAASIVFDWITTAASSTDTAQLGRYEVFVITCVTLAW